MKPRIEKKLSKKLCDVAPKLMRGAWVDGEVMESAYDCGVRVSNVMSIGGGLDYWGEGQDLYTCWQFLLDNWYYIFPFPLYPAGHEFEMHPNTEGFNPTTRNLIKMAAAHG